VEWTRSERRDLDFTYLHGSDLIQLSTELGADGFVSALSNALPELAVEIWNAALSQDFERASRLQSQFSRIAAATSFGSMHACLEVIHRERGLLRRMLPSPLRALDPESARRVAELVHAVGFLPALNLESTALVN
jgi:4-hydroxy-tetrahydrodipicolinate synthase